MTGEGKGSPGDQRAVLCSTVSRDGEKVTSEEIATLPIVVNDEARDRTPCRPCEAAFDGGEAERSKNQMLAKAAATTIANLTKSDESEYLVGSAPLRPTLTKSGILPTLRK